MAVGVGEQPARASFRQRPHHDDDDDDGHGEQLSGTGGPPSSAPAPPPQLPEETDSGAGRREYVVALPWLDAVLLPLMNDRRDLPLAYLLINVLVATGVPAVCIGVWQPDHPWLAPALFGANLVLWYQRFILMLHYASHRPVFRRASWCGAALNCLPDLLCAFFGLPPGLYYLHHVVMHHTENNVFPEDITSTLPYQRDSFLAFLRYWARYVTYTWVYLPPYAARKGRYGLAAGAAACSLSYLGGCYFLATRHSLWMTAWFLLIPYALSSFLLMFGNFCQHLFVDPRVPPEDFRRGLAYTSYRSTYSCMNVPDNQLSFNDGYHIAHHVNSRLHWSELPRHQYRHLAAYRRHDALIFQGISFMEVGLLAMTGRLATIARAHVDIGGAGGVRRSQAALVAELRRRLQPIHL